MTINTTDIKLLESERMSDASDGGGRRTSRVIVDGAPSNIFPKVSRLDSVYGRVNMRKGYGAVVTANLDTYAGAHAVIMDPPNNGQIHVNLFTTGSDYDTRAAARDRIESYVISGPESRMVLYGRQLVGQQALLAYQRVEEPLPEVGEVYCLSKEVGKVVQYQQFVRVTDLTNEVRTFTDENGEYQRRVLALKVGAPLRYQFDGPETPSRLSNVVRESIIRATTVADAARYFGVKKLTDAVTAGALTVQVESVYSPIVPTTQRETAIPLAAISGAGGYVATAATARTEDLQENGFRGSFSITRHTTRSIQPRTLSLVFSGVVIATDDGSGTIEMAGNVTSVLVSAVTGTVDYQSGTIYVTVTLLGSTVSSLMASYIPAVEVSDPARTRAIEITLANRGAVFSEVLNPLPSPGSAIVDYRALGKWYRLRDDGTGQLTGGDTAYGTGTVDYVTGALVITLGALPDVESSVLISWGSPVDFEVLAGATADVVQEFQTTFVLDDAPIQPTTVVIEYRIGGNTYEMTDAAGTGQLVGDDQWDSGKGFVNYTTGQVKLRFTRLNADPGSVLDVTFNKAVDAVSGEGAIVSGTWNTPGTTMLPQYPVATSSFVTSITVAATEMVQHSNGSSFPAYQGGVNLLDDGAGHLIVPANSVLGSTWQNVIVRASADTQVGTINYATGQVTITQTAIPSTYKQYAPTNLQEGEWTNKTGAAEIVVAISAFQYRVGGSISAQNTTTQQISMLAHPSTIDLTRTKATPVVPGSVMFSIRDVATATTHTYLDRNGTIYRSFSPTTGAATPCGSIDYTTGIATLGDGFVASSDITTLAVLTCLTRIGNFSAIGAFFRTAGSPVRPGSFYVQATAQNGELLTGTSDASGNVTGPKVRGHIVQEMGVASVEFGAMVTPTGGGAAVWTPIEIAPNTLRYSAVVLSNLPLNADILGLDPVRLPSDGRVPIYRAADVVVIHNTKTLELPNPLTAGSTHSMGRTALSEVWLTDADGNKVAPSKYAVNLDTGVLTMAADLNLAGTPQPLVAHHRIEEMQLLSDVQINGTLSLTAVLGRGFDADSYVSSALLFGDLNARYTNLFDQASWTSVWANTLIGNGATAQYNDIDYPVEVLNDGAVTDRWRINFTTGNPSTGTAAFQVISENLGVIATGNTGTDCAPVNALTGKPYFVIRAGGWGIGWSVGNQVRFNTVAAAAPIWIARTILPGATLQGDSFDLQLRGDVDA